MFLRAWKHKKIADAVLAHVQPDLVATARLIGGIPDSLTTDKYVLGYFCISIGIAIQRVTIETFINALQLVSRCVVQDDRQCLRGEAWTRQNGKRRCCSDGDCEPDGYCRVEWRRRRWRGAWR